jgi:hypothetical protein
MESFDFWAREWPLITQAPHIALAGLVAVLVAAWSITKWHYSGRLACLKERIEMLQERERDVKEKLIEAKNLVVELNDQIEANEQQSVLLRSSSSTIAAFDHLVSATNQLGVTLAASRPWTKRSSINPLIPLTWRHEPPDTWKASSSWPDVGFRIEMESSDCFVLLGARSHLGEFPSLDDAKRGAEEYRYRTLIERRSGEVPLITE